MDISEDQAYWGVNYKPGYVGFTVTRDSLIAQGISWFQKWDWLHGLPLPTHTFIVTGEDETVEAFPDGVKCGTMRHYIDDPDVCILVRRPLDYSLDMGWGIVREAKLHIGEKYGFGLIAGMAVTNSLLGKALSWATRGWFARTVEGWADGKKSQICSELVARALQAQPQLNGVGILADRPATITPMELFKDCLCFEGGATELV
jgi:hypothetical protein